ncbi:ATP-binding protein [Agromyces sp. NPDC055658]
MSDVWKLYPFPTMTDSSISDGSLFDVHRDCARCPTRECVDDDTKEYGVPKLCRYGLTYARIDKDRVTAGLVAPDIPSPTSRAKKRIRLERQRHVPSARLKHSVDAVRELGPGVVDSFEANREVAVASLKSDPDMQRAVAAQLRRDAENDLNQSHDFMQMVKRVKSYAEALLAERFPDLAPEEAAEQLHNEGAIFFATQLMVFKMNSLQYINEVNRAMGRESTFGIHPLILKYKRIYDWDANMKNLKIHLGQTFRQARYNGDAIGTLIQALLDNMVKYAPPRSEASIAFVEHAQSVTVQFRSLGPLIEEDELKNIFVMKVRAKAARRAESAGQGIGLAAAKHISDGLRLGIVCAQEAQEQPRFPGFYLTTFEFELATVS